MNKTNYKIEQVFNNTDETFEELLVKVVNTYVANEQNKSFEKEDIYIQENKEKYI